MQWNPWHGCVKFSEGCANCYVYRGDERYGRNSRMVRKCAGFDLPVRKTKDGKYKIPPGSQIYACFSSDFFLEEADPWRAEAWRMIRQRSDCHFLIITKRIHRFTEQLPADWLDGYKNVTIGCTCENNARAQYRLPLFLAAPINRKVIICEPLLEDMDISPFLHGVQGVVAGGESGEAARECNYDWILHLHAQCVAAGVPFWFKQTGARFKKDGKFYAVKRQYQHGQARKANINYEADALFEKPQP